MTPKILASIFIIICWSLLPAFGQVAKTPEKSIEAEVEAIRAEFELPAVAAAVVRTDGSVYTGATGVRIYGKPARVTTLDKFHVGSVGKSMTATMIATLVEQGKLKWTSTVGEIFRASKGIHPSLVNVTLEQLLTHRGGIPPFEEEEEPVWKALPKLTGTPSQIRRRFAEILLRAGAASPVGEHVYSNAGYCIAAVMAEIVTGKPWETLMRERLFTPAGMKSAGFGWPAKSDPNQPWGHQEDDKLKFVPQTPNGEYQLTAFTGPAGDMNMNIVDYAQYALLHLQGLRGTPRLLKSETFAKLHQPIGEYSLGWNRQILRGLAADTHSGSAGTFYAGILMIPEKDIAIVIFINDAGTRSNTARNKLFSLLLKKFGAID
jgi:D-alanyl-D-alanine carboxypeptidase